MQLTSFSECEMGKVNIGKCYVFQNTQSFIKLKLFHILWLHFQDSAPILTSCIFVLIYNTGKYHLNFWYLPEGNSFWI